MSERDDLTEQAWHAPVIAPAEDLEPSPDACTFCGYVHPLDGACIPRRR